MSKSTSQPQMVISKTLLHSIEYRRKASDSTRRAALPHYSYMICPEAKSIRVKEPTTPCSTARVLLHSKTFRETKMLLCPVFSWCQTSHLSNLLQHKAWRHQRPGGILWREMGLREQGFLSLLKGAMSWSSTFSYLFASEVSCLHS